MMRVEISIDKAFRGYIEQYSDATEVTMPQAYRDLLVIGLVCSDVDFNMLPVNEDDVSELIDDDIEVSEILE